MLIFTDKRGDMCRCIEFPSLEIKMIELRQLIKMIRADHNAVLGATVFGSDVSLVGQAILQFQDEQEAYEFCDKHGMKLNPKYVDNYYYVIVDTSIYRLRGSSNGKVSVSKRDNTTKVSSKKHLQKYKIARTRDIDSNENIRSTSEDSDNSENGDLPPFIPENIVNNSIKSTKYYVFSLVDNQKIYYISENEYSENKSDAKLFDNIDEAKIAASLMTKLSASGSWWGVAKYNK